MRATRIRRAALNNGGLVDIRNLSLGGLGTFIVIEYEVKLVAALPNQSYVQNQAQAYVSGAEIARSDDPNVNAAPDPLVLGDEDPTRVQITSAPKFRVLKTSTYLGASTTVLRAGDRMRYTITVKNIGTENATGVVIRDQVPANTTYVAGSTTLNGTLQNDNAQGITPLVDTIAIYAPENATAGVMRADATSTTTNVATITFDVTVYPDLADGTIISNQAFVSALDFGIVDYPSDDPRTPIVNDPTRDVVGNVPLLFADEAGGAADRQRLAGHRRSGRYAALHDHDVQQRRDSGDQRGAGRQRAAEHHLRRGHDDTERPAIRSAGQRLVAARGRHICELDRSDAAAADSGRGHALAAVERGRAIQPARERRNARPARSSATRRQCARPRCPLC